jgi:hypothetical protein
LRISAFQRVNLVAVRRNKLLDKYNAYRYFQKTIFLTALAGATLAHAGYEYRIPIQGIVLEAEAPKPTGPSLVGDGVS